MKLQNMTVRKFGRIGQDTYRFSDGVNLLCTRMGDELAYAICLVLHHKEFPPLPPDAARAGMQIIADVLADQKQYRVIVTADAGQNMPVLRAYDMHGREVTDEYLYLTDHCAEQDLSDVFEGGSRDTMPLRFLQYAVTDVYFSSRELSGRTEKMSELKAFRQYLRAYIGTFQPQQIREGKGYEIVMDQNGTYSVRHRGQEGMPVYLSETEQIVFRYLCFLHTAEFWCGFEQLRNMHGVRKPLVIKDFLERLDESVDVQGLVDRAAAQSRQIFVLTTAAVCLDNGIDKDCLI